MSNVIEIGFARDVAQTGVELIQSATSLEQALRWARNCFPTMQPLHAVCIYYNDFLPNYSENGNTITHFTHTQEAYRWHKLLEELNSIPYQDCYKRRYGIMLGYAIAIGWHPAQLVDKLTEYGFDPQTLVFKHKEIV